LYHVKYVGLAESKSVE